MGDIDLSKILSVGGGIASGVGILGGIGAGLINNAQLKRTLKNMPENQYNKLLGLAQTQLQGRGAGLAQEEKNIFQSGSDAMSRMQSAATSAADVMQASAGIQSQTNKALENLGAQDMADYQRRYQNFAGALQSKAEQDMRRYELETQIKGAMAQNRTTMLGTNPLNLGMAAMYAGAQKTS
tara:strand:- start:19470 stop:20012 length:543 start_codon:yes stop_codon:yes gene_type:complete